MKDAHADDAAFADDDAFGDFSARADEAIVFDDDGVRLQRLEHAAQTGAARDVAVLADLRAGADRRPGVDHRVFTDIGADVDEARHQDGAARDVRGVADDRARHGAEACAREIFGRPLREFRRHLVVPVARRRDRRGSAPSD